MNRTDRRRRAKEDEKLLVRGIDVAQQSPEPTAAMARVLHKLLEQAKLDRNLNRAMQFLYAKVDSTLATPRPEPRPACKKGCAHCCSSIWVSVRAPEAIFIAKLLRGRMTPDLGARIRSAHEATKQPDIETRFLQARQPCPLLVENSCSIYAHRPMSCRFAASFDENICMRSYIDRIDLDIPTPISFLSARNSYTLALVAALRHAQLPDVSYEMNAALVRALERPDAEAAWLSGEDVFSGVISNPPDAYASAEYQRLYAYAFES